MSEGTSLAWRGFLRRVFLEFYRSITGRLTTFGMFAAGLLGYFVKQSWLAPAAGVVAIAFCLTFTAVRLYLEHDQLVVFVPHRRRQSRLVELIAYVIFAALAIMAMILLPRPIVVQTIVPPTPEWAHFSQTQIGTRRYGSKQLLVVNLWYSNDGPKAQVKQVAHGVLAYGKGRNDVKVRDLTLRQLRTWNNWSFGKEPWQTFYPHTTVFFSLITEPALTDSALAQFQEGKMTFYYVAAILVKNSFGTQLIEDCGINEGDFRFVINCPPEGLTI